MKNKIVSYDTIADELMTQASRARAKKRANAILKRLTLDELRKDRKMTQGKLAQAMKVAGPFSCFAVPVPGRGGKNMAQIVQLAPDGTWQEPRDPSRKAGRVPRACDLVSASGD